MSTTVQNTETNESKLPHATGRFANFKADFMASLVVFLVALPLCIGIELPWESARPEH